MLLKKNSAIVLLILIFLFTLAFRLYFALTTDNLGTDDAYLTYRYSEGLVNNIGDFRYDNLSYGGREVLFNPLYYYILGIFSFLMPLLLVLKILPEIFFCLIVLIVYFISYQITRDYMSSLFASLISGFVPFLTKQTINQASVYSLSIPLILFALYSFLKIKTDKKYLYFFIISSIILTLIHQSVFILIIALLFYGMLLFSENMEINKLRNEAMMFAIFIIVLIELILFKDAFLKHGMALIWQNIPSSLLGDYYTNIDILSLVYGVGLIPIVLGCMGIYYGVLKSKRRGILLFSGLMLAIILFLLLRLLDFKSGIMLLGTTLPILASLGIKRTYQYIKLTRLSNYSYIFSILLIIFVTVFSIYPSFVAAKSVKYNSITNEEIDALNWIKDNTDKDSVVLAGIEEGHLITAIADRKNVIDQTFLLVDDAFVRLKDVQFIYFTWSEASALDLLSKYDVDYIYLSQRTKNFYKIDNIIYTSNKVCFEKVKENEKTEIYKVKC